jgi:hypothetical protein
MENASFVVSEKKHSLIKKIWLYNHIDQIQVVKETCCEEPPSQRFFT